MASGGSERPWRTGREGSQNALEVVLIRTTYVLPWAQFLYAEGRDDEVRLVFATHDVVVRGCGLQGLLTDLAANRLVGLREPVRAEKFTATYDTCIREVLVAKAGCGC
jgi:hypothetical protein